MAAQPLISVDFEVFGIVQGVFFRKYTQDQGIKLGVRGWCMNTYHGTVMGQVEGPREMVMLMKNWLQKTGSPSSRIDKVEFKNEKEIQEYTFKHFSVKH
ncbi:acylphosphatase-2-like isoform X2 [Homarus americanus]|uniref:acylphosphatase-2-like isoform X2 n=1 Tax=Homarus americanus TaxID=6706 RepID=UPI001C474CC0|nr:acylphosphatase-2-like isoform X2 [Homarus americanus]